MNRTLLITALLLPLGLMACDRPTIVNVPPAAEPVPGPPGPTGATGSTGSTGATGKTGDAAIVVVTPPAASAPAN